MNYVSGTVQARTTCCWTVLYAAWWRIWRRRWQSGCAAAGPSAWFRGSHTRGAVAVAAMAASRCTARLARLCSATGAPQSVPHGHRPHSRAPVLKLPCFAAACCTSDCAALDSILPMHVCRTSRVLILEELDLENQTSQFDCTRSGLCSMSLSPLDVG